MNYKIATRPTTGRWTSARHGRRPGDAIELLFDVGETDVARRALDGMLKLEDPVEGGFFRYATRADWTVPHYEKMLAGNAELLAAYPRPLPTARAGRSTDKRDDLGVLTDRGSIDQHVSNPRQSEIMD